jgi:hypothetical protein
VLVDSSYSDSLVVTHFGISIPDDASIIGLQFQVQRASLSGNAEDQSIRIMKDGVAVGVEHGQPGPWPASGSNPTSLGTLAPARYGGAFDTWGITWTPADIRAPNFGVAITPRYTGPPAGNERVYVDSVRVVVYYRGACE